MAMAAMAKRMNMEPRLFMKSICSRYRAKSARAASQLYGITSKQHRWALSNT